MLLQASSFSSYDKIDTMVTGKWQIVEFERRSVRTRFWDIWDGINWEESEFVSKKIDINKKSINIKNLVERI